MSPLRKEEQQQQQQHHYLIINKQQQNSNNNPLFDRKIEDIASGLIPYYSNLLYKVASLNEENALTIINYINAIRTETNLSDHYRMDLIRVLATFSIFFDNDKSFKQITRTDLLAFLNSFRKPESTDPLHKWVGTYNIHRIHLTRFFKWLYSLDIEPDKRPKPEVIENIPQLKRKEQSIYKPTDLWTEQDDILFLKYCPSKRIKCYHAISRDTSCRPHEILKLRIRDIVFKTKEEKEKEERQTNFICC